MPRKLLGPGRPSVFSPFIDVVMNALGAFILIFVIYAYLVRPKEVEPLQFLKAQIPAAAPYVQYSALIRITNGSGRFTFLGEASNLSANEGVIVVDHASGLVSANFTRDGVSNGAAKIINLKITVQDNGMRKVVPTEHAERWTNDSAIVYLYFHEEWPSDKQVGRLNAPADSASVSNQVSAFYAVRGTLPIRLEPMAVPFDPAANPLRLITATAGAGVQGVPLELFVAPSGGIPPYEFKFEGAPSWLKLDAQTGSLKGVPPQPGRFYLRILVKDGQTPPARWDQADRLKNNPGHPLVAA